MRLLAIATLLISSTSIADAVIEAFSRISDEQRESIVGRNSDEFDRATAYPLTFDPKQVAEWRPGAPVFGPFPITESMSLVYSVHGDWTIYSSDEGTKSFRFLAFDKDRGTPMIVELDPDKITDGTD